jgi:hypothetical protein
MGLVRDNGRQMSPRDLPMACSLDAGEMPKLLAAMTEIGRADLLSAKVDGMRAELQFSSGEQTASRLETIVAAEGECCPFLTLELTDEGDSLRLTIDAPEGGEQILLKAAEGTRTLDLLHGKQTL